ncbi:DUF308 domain-containing protein [Jannaschia formosa]|uniref:DUF308 domain-containing protein n=1 Tax=Jannaschia formosa TaxID=2259592 RepID=UPI00142F9693|nr:DUF308 domain-containing protein [Jannaschia formosa]
MNGWLLWMALGVLSLIAGGLALMNPFVASITAELIAAWAFVAIGAISCVAAFRNRGDRTALFVGLALGLVFVVMGVVLLLDPLRGLLSLTLLFSLLLILGGGFRLVYAFGAERGRTRVAMIASGVVSILLAAVILAGFPASAVIVPGVVLAVELISNGVSLILLALDDRRIADRAA